MNMYSHSHPRVLSVLAAVTHMVGGSARRLLWLGTRAVRQALPGPAGAEVTLNNGRNDGPPDLDELWRDMNRKLSGLFNNRGGADQQPPSSSGGGGGADGSGAGIGAGLIGG